EEFIAVEGGYVAGIQTERIGWAGMALGAGREKVDDQVDPAVGFTVRKKVGDPVQAGEPVVTIHYNRAEKLPECRRWLEGAFRISNTPPEPTPLIHKTLT
ncbi:MAG: hypothetical protein ACRD2M_10660, partial [Terriglobales bacterium]